MQLAKENSGISDTAACYLASGKQVLCWRYHSSLKQGTPHEILTFEADIGDADIGLVIKAIEFLFRRHESLRTSFVIVDEDIQQCVFPYDTRIFSPLLCDMRGYLEKEPMLEEIRSIVHDQKAKLSRIDAPPLIRICIFLLPDNGVHLSLMIHHIVSDLWSIGVIYRDVFLYYQHLKTQTPLQIQPLSMQLRDYAEWQRSWQEKNGETVRKYWVEKLQCFDSSPDPYNLYCQYRLNSDLPLDRPVSGQMTEQDFCLILGGKNLYSYSSHFGAEVHRQLLQFAQECRCSIWTIITAAIQLLFSLMGQSRVLLVMSLADRSVPDFKLLIGYLIGSVYLQRPVQKDTELRTFVKEGYLDFLEAATHIIYDQNDIGLDETALRLHSKVFLNFANRDIGGHIPPPHSKNNEHNRAEQPNYYALTYVIQESDTGLSCFWKYNGDLYSPEKIEYMAAVLGQILEKILAHPSSTTGELLW
jgi:hypothetical protein